MEGHAETQQLTLPQLLRLRAAFRLYFIYTQELYARTHVKFTRQWKFTLRKMNEKESTEILRFKASFTSAGFPRQGEKQSSSKLARVNCVGQAFCEEIYMMTRQFCCNLLSDKIHKPLEKPFYTDKKTCRKTKGRLVPSWLALNPAIKVSITVLGAEKWRRRPPVE